MGSVGIRNICSIQTYIQKNAHKAKLILKHFSFICIKGYTWGITFRTSIFFCLLTLWLSNRFQHYSSPHRLISTHIIWIIFSLKKWLSSILLFYIIFTYQIKGLSGGFLLFSFPCAVPLIHKILLVRHPCLSCKSHYAKQQTCNCCVDLPTILSYLISLRDWVYSLIFTYFYNLSIITRCTPLIKQAPHFISYRILWYIEAPYKDTLASDLLTLLTCFTTNRKPLTSISIARMHIGTYHLEQNIMFLLPSRIH